MVPQFLERLWPIKVSVSGYSRPNGFNIRVGFAVTQNRWRFPFEADESIFPKEECLDWPVAALLFGLVISSIWAHAWLVAMISIWIIFQYDAFDRRFKSWHWCEHQVVELLNDRMPITRGLLRSQTPVTVMCGSVYLATRAIMHVAWVAATIHTCLREPAPALVCLVLAWSAGCAHHVIKSKYLIYHLGWVGPILFALLSTLGLPAFLLAMVIERVFYLRKPTALQQELALHWGQLAAADIPELEIQENALVDETPK